MNAVNSPSLSFNICLNICKNICVDICENICVDICENICVDICENIYVAGYYTKAKAYQAKLIVY